MRTQPTGARAKSLGAYYTDEAVAAFLCGWAIRSPDAKVVDPSFGGGVFLEAASRTVRELGGNPGDQVYGVELDTAVHHEVSRELESSHGIDGVNLLRSDFFDVEPDRLPEFDAVVGNPPFIRYQSFAGPARAKALRRAELQGVELSSLTSSWAPFLVHSCALLKPGGRLAMVIPMEIGHASYAKPVLAHLSRVFARVTLLTFRSPLFPDLSQDTLLLLGDGKDEPFDSYGWRDLEHPGELDSLDNALPGRVIIDHEGLALGQDRFAINFLEPRARDLYRELIAHVGTARLGDLARVGIGYVSGANDYFHVSPAQVAALDLPSTVLERAVFRGRALNGVSFSDQDWVAASESGSAGYLLRIASTVRLDASTEAYVSHGATLGVDRAYKCRVRSPWYSVPGVQRPDAFITYMSGLRPVLVENRAHAVAPNSLHTVRIRPGVDTTAKELAVAWRSSLTSLSVEIEGHAMGGGMLKLEPREAQNVLVPTSFELANELVDEVDRLVRDGRFDRARQLVDEEVLQGGLGLSVSECEVLAAAADSLRTRRYYRGRAA